jgi:quinol monooxygenase YgiN
MAGMIFIVVKFRVRPEVVDDWPSLVGPFTAATRAEPGNISFDWFRSLEEPNLYVLVEAFRDGEAGRLHVESDHFTTAIAEMPQWLRETPEIVNVETPTDGWSRMSEMQVEQSD